MYVLTDFKLEFAMKNLDLATTITAAALVPAELVPETFDLCGGSVRYLTYFESLAKVVEAFESDRGNFVGYYIPYNRSGIRKRFPQLESIKVQWNDGPKHGGAYYYTQELSLGECALPGYMLLEDRVVHAGSKSAKESFFKYWKSNYSFATIGNPGSVNPTDVAKGKIWQGLKSIRVFYLHKCQAPVRYGEDRWRQHPEPEPYWSYFEVKAESDEEFSQIFEF